ncbi:MAG: hypothetical protein JXB45_03690 [Candidatus Krumholzibacteriota bacterium]|nr:hypothetical protein [Candidatus Krumholzibacteriota bacterium]
MFTYTVMRIILSILCLAMILSILVQDYSGYIPSAIFNRGKGLYYTLSIASLVLLLGVIVLLMFIRKKEILIRLILIFSVFFALELALRFFDHFFVDHPGGIVGQCYNVNGAFLLRPNRTNRLGLNEDYDYAKEVPPGKTRILFLGDSYTFGSGSSRSESYCRIAQQYLLEHGQADFEVFNAGVPGYSPRNAHQLLRFLKGEGYRFQAVVMSLLLQNDFTDDIRNTHTAVVAGIPQRLPDNPALKYLHPLNSYLFRYLRVLERLWGRLQDPVTPVPARGDEYTVSPVLFERVEANYRKGAYHDFEGVLGSLTGMAEECGVPFHIVLIPDQFFGSDIIREKVRETIIRPDDYDFDIYYRWIDDRLRDRFNLFDLTGLVRECPHCYLDRDTHFNDRGNRLAGEAVAKYLLEQNTHRN